jgi:putative ABC transport system permease protein
MANLLRSLFVAVAFVFLTTCANIAALELARALTRRREFAIRRALGDSRLGLVRSMIIESLVVSVLAGIAGLSVSVWLTDLVLAMGPTMPRATGIRLDTAVFGFALAISITAGLLVALPAAMLATRVDLARALKEESGQVTNARAARLRLGFVTAQIALALMLVGGAIVAGATVARQLALQPGFEPRGLATASISPPARKYATASQVASLYDRILEAARAVQGVEHASAVSATPLSGEGVEPVEFTVLDASGAGQSAPYTAHYFNAAPAHFATLRTPLRQGRDFTAADTSSSTQVAIVNETFVRKFLDRLEPLGTRIRLVRSTDVVTIVGVAADVLRDLQPRSEAAAEIYWPYSQRARWATTLVIRADDPGRVLTAVLDRVRQLDGDVRIGPPRLVADRVARSSRGPRFVLILFSLFAGVATLLCAIGVYGLVSYTFTQRIGELGIRVSLGASPRHILREVARSGFAAVLLGGIAGGIGLFALGRALDSVMPQLGPVDIRIIAAAALVVIVVGCAASYFPARRAARLDPIRAMRAS